MPTDEEKFINEPLGPWTEAQWRLMRRDDLASVVGVVLRVPIHGQDSSGHWRYGLRPEFWDAVNPEVRVEFEAEMRRIVIDAASPLVDAGILSAEQVEAIRSHPYQTGPAAGDWRQFFFEVYQQADPFISAAANSIAIADFLKQVAEGARKWQQRRREEAEEHHRDRLDRTISLDPDPQLVLTLPGLVSLCYEDLVRRHGKTGDINIVVYPRVLWAGIVGSVDHPGGSETYVIRLIARDSEYFYLTDGRGTVSEHYRTEGDDLILLPLPDLLLNDASDGKNRQPEAPLRFEVRTSPMSRS